MLEKEILLKIREAITQKYGDKAFAFKMHGGQYGSAGVPDIIGCVVGKFVGIEVKRPGGKATVLQSVVMRRIKAAGGRAGVATSVSEAMDIIEGRGV